MTPPRIYGDWGSTRLRLWLRRDGTDVDARYGLGIVGLARPPGDVLREAIAPWLGERPAAIRLCGMAGARGGLHEAPYAPCPIAAAEWRQASAELVFDGLPLRIGAGLQVHRGARCEVMRGEETQAFGAARLDPSLAVGRRTLVLPGTHSKWVELDDGCIRDLRTFLTGELFALLQRSSLLNAGTAGAGSEDDGFAAGIAAAGDEAGLLGSLFQARAWQVAGGRSHAWAEGFLSGLLLASEAVARRRAGTLPDRVVVIGAPALGERYRRALAAFGTTAETLDGDACVLAGLELLDDDA